MSTSSWKSAHSSNTETGRSLAAKGFSQPLAAGDPPYRWTARDGAKLDVSANREAILGFANRWYREAIAAREARLREGFRSGS